MNVGCFVMMRNETPILGPFLDQIESLFDRCFVLNHGSTDGSDVIVAQRNPAIFSTYRLNAAGYPQSEVATYFAHEAFEKEGLDFLFFLDCDEFLPFVNRQAMLSTLIEQAHVNVLRMPWLNVCPQDFGGGNIFAKPFYHQATSTVYHKIILNKSILKDAPRFVVSQGYHDIVDPDEGQPSIQTLSATPLIHIPVQSRIQLGFKLANGHNRLLHEQVNASKRNGFHWIDLAKEFADGKLGADAMRSLAICYPSQGSEKQVDKLSFDFPYVKTAYEETPTYIASQIAALIGLSFACEEQPATNAFSVTDSNGDVVFTAKLQGARKMNHTTADEKSPQVRQLVEKLGNFQDDFSSLIEPLFNLPTKLPITAWQGHIPFMFVVMKLLKPKRYVELGVHNGASLIAAATAARTYSLDTELNGIDAWMGDEHAGTYDGGVVYSELKSHVDANFTNVNLIKSFFSEARSTFANGSVDLLHIDGLHTYEAVKEDFTTWLSAMTPNGIILFHDICVYDRGFGVHRFWAELKNMFTTVEFHHSHGLGILFLNPEDKRITPLSALGADSKGMGVYQDLASYIAGVLPERMRALEHACATPVPPHPVEQYVHDGLEHEVNAEVARLRAEVSALRASTSWRITAPIRAIKKLYAK